MKVELTHRQLSMLRRLAEDRWLEGDVFEDGKKQGMASLAQELLSDWDLSVKAGEAGKGGKPSAPKKTAEERLQERLRADIARLKAKIEERLSRPPSPKNCRMPDSQHETITLELPTESAPNSGK